MNYDKLMFPKEIIEAFDKGHTVIRLRLYSSEYTRNYVPLWFYDEGNFFTALNGLNDTEIFVHTSKYKYCELDVFDSKRDKTTYKLTKVVVPLPSETFHVFVSNDILFSLCDTCKNQYNCIASKKLKNVILCEKYECL